MINQETDYSAAPIFDHDPNILLKIKGRTIGWGYRSLFSPIGDTKAGKEGGTTIWQGIYLSFPAILVFAGIASEFKDTSSKPGESAYIEIRV